MLINKISKKLGYVFASLVLMTAQMTPFFVFGGQRALADNIDNLNDWPAWCVGYDGGFKVEIEEGEKVKDQIKVDFSDDEKTVTVSEQGTNTIMKVVVKAGSDASVDDPNKVYTVAPWVALTAPENKEISHVIVCYNEVELEPTTIKVTKNIVPTNDNGLFDLYINDSKVKDDAGNGDQSSTVQIDADKSVEISEKPGNENVLLKDYTTYIECKNQTGAVIVSGNRDGLGSRTLTVVAEMINVGDSITCVFTNTRIPVPEEKGTLVVKKVVTNDNGGQLDYSNFTFSVNGYGNNTFLEETSPNGVREIKELPIDVKYTVVENEENKNGYKTTYDNCVDIELKAGSTETCTITNDDVAPSLTLVKKVINDNGGKATPDDFKLTIDGKLVKSGEKEYFNAGVPLSINETQLAGYKFVSIAGEGCPSTLGGMVTLSLAEDVVCTITNDDIPVTIVATKIVCDDEMLLPNWGNGGPDITKSTVVDWLANPKNDGCKRVEGWNFEYAFNNASNPGDNYEDTAWEDFGPTNSDGETSVEIDDVSDVNRIWIREQLKDGYLGFTFNANNKTNVDAISAELYCHTDVLNYDNYDFIDNPMYGNTYYCVAWNVRESVPEVPPKVYVTKHTCESDCEDDTKFDFELFNNGLKYSGFSLSNGGTFDTGNGLKTGNVTVVEKEKAGWNLKNANCYYYRELELNLSRLDGNTNDNKVFVGTNFTAENGVNYYCDFYNEEKEPVVETGTIIVTKFNDLDNDGIKDAGEPNLQGWEIIIEGQGVKLTGLTGPDGTVTFSNLKLGSYKVSEVLQNGWVQTVNYCEDNSQNECVVGAEEPVECFIGNYKPGVVLSGTTPPTSKPQVLGVTTLATTGDNQGSFAFVTGLTLIAATLLTIVNRKRETVSVK